MNAAEETPEPTSATLPGRGRNAERRLKKDLRPRSLERAREGAALRRLGQQAEAFGQAAPATSPAPLVTGAGLKSAGSPSYPPAGAKPVAGGGEGTPRADAVETP